MKLKYYYSIPSSFDNKLSYRLTLHLKIGILYQYLTHSFKYIKLQTN